ncbi:hypothetical protein [Nonomuraea sp. NPDC050310]|uniref:hypothetical protein n=1 Tax=Nonomuraea sp. NPDC050310 TaxID=3154935 RepID=UPI0033CDA5D8
MRAVQASVIPERAEEEQIEQLLRLQELLAGEGVRALLVRHLRLALFQNRYDPPQHRGPVLVAGAVKVSAAEAGFHVEHDSGSAGFAEAEAAAGYVSSLITAARSGGST